MRTSNTYRKSLSTKKSTKSTKEFNNMRLWFPNRQTIVAQGDSWFAYPKKWIFVGKPSNLIDHLSTWTRSKANFYSMASNGAEAVDMLSGKQKHELIMESLVRITPSASCAHTRLDLRLSNVADCKD